mgnify:CR=1 FL=1
MILKSRVYNYIALSNGYTNHFDRLDNNVIEQILKYMYPMEVYESRVYYKSKKNMLEQLKNIKIKINTPYDSLSIKHKFKYHKKYDNQYYIKPEIKKNLYLSDKKVKKSCIDKIMIKQNKLLLNNICILGDDNSLVKCICNSYCSNPLKKWRYTHRNIITYNSFKIRKNDKKNHYNILSNIIQNEKKCLKYGDNICYCNTCDKYMKKSSIKNHTKGKEHKYKTNKYNYNLVLEELKNWNQ